MAIIAAIKKVLSPISDTIITEIEAKNACTKLSPSVTWSLLSSILSAGIISLEKRMDNQGFYEHMIMYLYNMDSILWLQIEVIW